MAIPRKGHKAAATSTHVSLGGNAAISALHMRRLGAQVDVFTVLGDADELVTQATVDLLRNTGVGLDHVRGTPGVMPAMSHVWLDHKGERTISSYQDPALVAHKPRITVPHTYDVLLFDNYRLPLNEAVQEQSSHKHRLLILDVDHPLNEATIAQLPCYDQVWFSEETLADHTLEQIQESSGVPIVGVTRGSQGVQWINQDHEHFHVAVKKVKARNTLGAGDAWKGALCYYLALGQDQESAVKSACDYVTSYLRES